MRRLTSRTPELDFVVIGAQKAGTTSLWRYLEDNPRLAMPPGKESTFFTEPQWRRDLSAYLRALFKDAPRRAKLGTVTPVYMLGAEGVSVPTVAERIAYAAPGAKLIAILREPVERAFSAYRMTVREHDEMRAFPEAIETLLEPSELERARAGPAPEDSYVVAGEYGRMLETYLQHFDRDQLHVELTADLEREPGEVVRRVCEFIGVEPHQPRRAGERFYPSGRPRIAPEDEAELKGYLERHVWPRMRHPTQHREAFEFWFRLWNSIAEPAQHDLGPELEARLREHYAQDARRLEAVTGLQPPWRILGSS
jgi:hypothetical protein